MQEHIEAIHQWNKDTGLIKKFDQYKEMAMILEEVYEALGVENPKQTARNFVQGQKEWNEMRNIVVQPVDFLDAICDVEYVLHGTKAKMGLTPLMDAQSLKVVIEANQQKLNAGQDEEGKQRKPENWDDYAPEPKLQVILDRVKHKVN